MAKAKSKETKSVDFSNMESLDVFPWWQVKRVTKKDKEGTRVYNITLGIDSGDTRKFFSGEDKVFEKAAKAAYEKAKDELGSDPLDT